MYIDIVTQANPRGGGFSDFRDQPQLEGSTGEVGHDEPTSSTDDKAATMVCESEPRNTCPSGCCDEQRKEVKPKDACVPQGSDEGRTERCCSTENPQEEDLNNPSCCKDKPSPCCDVSCLDRIALRECHKEQIPSPSCGVSPGEFKSDISDFGPNRLH